MEIRPEGAEFLADGPTDIDMTKLIVAFRNFANAPKTACLLFVSCARRIQSTPFLLLLGLPSDNFPYHFTIAFCMHL